MCWIKFTSGWPAIQGLVGRNTGELIASSNETLSGLSTITAYNAGSVFDQRILDKIESTEKSFFLVTVLGRWLNLRVDVCSASMVAVTMLLCLIGKIEASLAGLLILYSLNAAYVVAWFISTMAETQSELFAFDRVMALALKLKAETEQLSSKLAVVPPPTWPQAGRLHFRDVWIKYRPELPPVIKGVSLSIESGKKIALVGRTGSGKSSLIAALYRVMQPESGWIEIDGIDTAQIPLSTLRHALSIVPQDPVLFAGTLRFNMDPEDEHTDEQIWSVLRETGIDGEVKGLDARIEEKGSNYSTGQRQLLCLARALLRPTKILVIDEATANVDHCTDMRIQAVLREHVKRTGCTLITVAHRISTIIDYDRIAVLDAGNLVEFGSPAELLAINGGAFKTLADKAYDPSAR
jgi:ABC-type multidrug transport system fused ATPase/permease subunit